MLIHSEYHSSPIASDKVHIMNMKDVFMGINMEKASYSLVCIVGNVHEHKHVHTHV